ncbi:MAG: efflux transporter periplasmic adaptor subunit [Chitinophagaceae bacterium]|nr:efflux transporter periplasmic adaptor subunit [Chitinophagaceae bacterium]
MDMKNRTLLFLINSIALLFFSCNQSPKEIANADSTVAETSLVTLTEPQYKSAGIVLGHLEERSMSGLIKVNGIFDVPPQNLVTISLPYAGIVKQTSLLQGLKVKKGEVIAVMEHPDYIQLQQDYLENKSKLDYMQLEMDRQNELQKENVNSAKVYQQTQSEFETLQARVSGLKEKLSLINISVDQLQKKGISKQIRVLAPITGYVTQVNVNIGMFVNPNDIICKIVDIGHLHVELTAFEKDVMSLKIGQKVRFEVNGETEPRTASVYLIGKEISKDRTVRIHCHLDKEDPSLLPGMYLTAYIETNKKRSWALPSKAIVNSANANYIFIAKGKQKLDYVFDMVEVSLGIVDEDYTEVILPLSMDQHANIVIHGAYDLLSKRNVEEE